MKQQSEKENEANWSASIQENIIENLVENPALLALTHALPLNFARWSQLIARADAELARRAIDVL